MQTCCALRLVIIMCCIHSSYEAKWCCAKADVAWIENVMNIYMPNVTVPPNSLVWLPPLKKGGNVFTSVCMSVCMFVCLSLSADFDEVFWRFRLWWLSRSRYWCRFLDHDQIQGSRNLKSIFGEIFWRLGCGQTNNRLDFVSNLDHDQDSGIL